MATRDNPYGAFNFLVEFGDVDGGGPISAAFSDVSGLGNEIVYAEYRNGNDKSNHVRKIATLNKTDDVTLKRGVVGTVDLYLWLKATREGSAQRRTVSIVLLDEARNAVCSWILTNAQPKKWVGPTLVAKGGAEVAMEELVLVAERIDFESF